MNPVGAVGRAVQDYLTDRRRLGYGMHDTELQRFARYADERGHEGPLDAERQISWARQHVSQTTSGTGTRRLETLRPFVRYYRQFEPESVVVDPSILGPSRGRLTPHIYTSNELEALVLAATQLKRVDPLRPATYSTLFGLLAATGMRRSEALNLLDDDVDVDGSRLVIRRTKFRKSRQLPLHPSTATALLLYRRERNQCWSRTKLQPFFVGRAGAALCGDTLHAVFSVLRQSLGWRARGDHPQPRIHDLRHTFAVRRVQQWHEHGVPTEQAMFWLCTYLGHAKISDTYWYLTGVPELMAVAGRRFEAFAAEPELRS